MNFPTLKQVEAVRKRYPVGCRIQLDYMGEDPRPIPEGTQGTVNCIDDMGTLHVAFDNGRHLGLCLGEDKYHKI